MEQQVASNMAKMKPIDRLPNLEELGLDGSVVERLANKLKNETVDKLNKLFVKSPLGKTEALNDSPLMEKYKRIE